MEAGSDSSDCFSISTDELASESKDKKERKKKVFFFLVLLCRLPLESVAKTEGGASDLK